MPGITPSSGHEVPRLYDEMVPRLKALAERINRTELEMADLARQFSIRVPRCPLVLYAKIEPALRGRGRDARRNPRFSGGRPRGLYWGSLTRTHVILHRKGRLTSGMICKIARRGRLKPLFWAFERERLHLNRTRTILVKAREDLRKMLQRYLSLPPARPVSAFLRDLHPLEVRHLPLVQGLFRLARAAEEIPVRMEEFVARFRTESASVPYHSLRFQLRLVNVCYRTRRLYVSFGCGRIPAERLTRRLLVQAGIEPGTQDHFRRYQREAVALNRAESAHRARVVRVRRLLRRADVMLNVRRRTRRKEAVAG